MSQADASDAEEKPKKSKLKIIIILVALLLLLGVGAAVYFLMGDSLLGEKGDTELAPAPTVVPAETQTPAPTTPAATKLPATFLTSIPPLTINLADIDITRYLRIAIDVELSTAESVTQLQAQSAKIRDAIIILLSSKTFENISTASGKLQIKNEIITRINQILGVPRVVQIYFTDFVVQ